MGFFLLFFWVCVWEREREIERGRKRENSPWKHKAIGKRRIGYKSKRGGHAEVDLHTKLGFSPEWRKNKKEEKKKERERKRERERERRTRWIEKGGSVGKGREGEKEMEHHTLPYLHVHYGVTGFQEKWTCMHHFMIVDDCKKYQLLEHHPSPFPLSLFYF